MSKQDPENVKKFSQILENPDEGELKKWLEDNLTTNISALTEITSQLNDTFFGPLSPFREPRYNNAENFQVLLSVQQHINDQLLDTPEFTEEVVKALDGAQDDLLKFMHAVTILWKTEIHGPGETPRFPPNLIKDKLESNMIVDEKIASFLVDRLIVNILWPIHREHVDQLSIEEIEEFLLSFSKHNFSEESLNYFVKTYFFHYFREGDERVNGLRNANSNDEFSKGFTNYLIGSRLKITDPSRTPMLLQALDSFIETNDQQRQDAILARLMRGGVDTQEENGSYTQTFSNDGTLHRMTSILYTLDPDTYSEQVINSVVNEIVEYMMYRIRRNNQQCMNCNRFHAEQPRLEIDDLDKITEFYNAGKNYNRIEEIVGILQLLRDGETQISPVENPIFERWMNEKENIENVLSLYSLDSCDHDDIIFSSLGCILHAASNHLSDENATSIINGLKSQLTSRKSDFEHEGMKNFIDCILQLINKVASNRREDWREDLNQSIQLDLEKFLLRRDISVEQHVYAVELHRTMISNDNLHPNYEENFYQVFLFMEHIIDEFDNESQYPIELLNEFHSMRVTLHRGLTGYIEAITSDDETRVEQQETFGFTIERLENIQAKLLPKDE
ncbi:MAG: hypothetical protein ACPHUK_07440 [Candidatus Poseidoniaceae archaeon]